MKLAVISDLHDNLTNLDKCLGWCSSNGMEALMFAGDLTNKDTLDYLAKKFSGSIYLVRGNACNYDEGLLKNYSKITYLTRAGGVTEVGGRSIGLCHEPDLIDNLLKQKPEIIFYGHTHKPWSSYAPYNTATLEKQKAPASPARLAQASAERAGGSEDKDEIKSGVRLVNPGTLGGMFQKATFAVYDTASNEPELKILETLFTPLDNR